MPPESKKYADNEIQSRAGRLLFHASYFALKVVGPTTITWLTLEQTEPYSETLMNHHDGLMQGAVVAWSALALLSEIRRHTR